VAVSETATARIAATTESMAYRDGIALLMADVQMDRVIVRRSSEARVSSDSDSDPEKGRVDVRGDATAEEAPSSVLAGRGAVTRIVGA
jgi:hypothetical protein